METSTYCHGNKNPLSWKRILIAMELSIHCHRNEYSLLWKQVPIAMETNIYSHGNGYQLPWKPVLIDAETSNPSPMGTTEFFSGCESFLCHCRFATVSHINGIRFSCNFFIANFLNTCINFYFQNLPIKWIN